MTSSAEPVAATTMRVVLVADDDIHINTLITRLLRRAGYDVVRVHDGYDAITELDSRHVDLLILDLMMPRVDGFGVIAHLQQMQPELLKRTIVVTAFPESEALLALKSPCRILRKPFDAGELLEAVRGCAAA